MGSTLKIFVFAVILLGVALAFGCEDEKKTVCCECTCVDLNNTTGEPRTDTQTISGNNLNCSSACRSHCDFPANQLFVGWDLEKATEVECPSSK